jgi:hypothetical protein
VDRNLSLARRAGAKALAAFALVFAGCGTIAANAEYHRALGPVGISLKDTDDGARPIRLPA